MTFPGDWGPPVVTRNHAGEILRHCPSSSALSTYVKTSLSPCSACSVKRHSFFFTLKFTVISLRFHIHMGTPSTLCFWRPQTYNLHLFLWRVLEGQVEAPGCGLLRVKAVCRACLPPGVSVFICFFEFSEFFQLLPNWPCMSNRFRYLQKPSVFHCFKWRVI